MRSIARERFIPPQLADHAYDDGPLPIGYGQTISQPYMVAVMCQVAELSGVERVLEIGTGSGYQAAILAQLAREVYSIESLPSLHDRARATLRGVGIANVHLRAGDGSLGWPEEMPFDVIVVTAAMPGIPRPLLDQLTPMGRLVAPVGEDELQALVRIRRIDGSWREEYFGECRFVRMTGRYGFPEVTVKSIRREVDEGWCGGGVANRRKCHLAYSGYCLGLLISVVTLAAGCMSADSGSSRSAPDWGSRSLANGSQRTHTVAPGETVYRIAREYGISSSRLMAANGLNDARSLAIGQILVIPGRPLAAASVMGDAWLVPRADRQFAWPVMAGVVSSPFGMRGGVMHEGVDIAAPAGTPVRAADDGTVIYTGRLHGYGNVVIVQHTGGYVTIYGHNQRNLVRDGERVSVGQQIAELGATGRASGPNLHFEVRYNNHPQNPLGYLPAPGPSSGISFARNAVY